MKVYSEKKDTEVISGISCVLSQLQPEISALMKHAPEYGIATLEIHFFAGKIKRIIRKREESVKEGGFIC